MGFHSYVGGVPVWVAAPHLFEALQIEFLKT
jgi:hypothetical protein